VAAKDVDPKSPYNTEAPNHQGLPPSAIANASWDVIKAAASPLDVKAFPYFYFVSDKCGKIYYGKDNTDFNNNVVPKINTGNC
jgi:cell division protein YceG involved in septum cleavage